MTAPTVDWVPSGEVAAALGIKPDWIRKLFRAQKVHAHQSCADEPGRTKTGQWWMAANALSAARRGDDTTAQRLACGCHLPGWSPPPAVVGRSRRAWRT